MQGMTLVLLYGCKNYCSAVRCQHLTEQMAHAMGCLALKEISPLCDNPRGSSNAWACVAGLKRATATKAIARFSVIWRRKCGCWVGRGGPQTAVDGRNWGFVD